MRWFLCLFSNGFFYSWLKNMSAMYFQKFSCGNGTLVVDEMGLANGRNLGLKLMFEIQVWIRGLK